MQTLPRNSSFTTQFNLQAGVHVPSLSLLVISPFGPAPIPFGARTPVAKTSNLEPSFEIFAESSLGDFFL